MPMFEEEAWDAAAEVNTLKDGLFGKKQESHKPSAAGDAPKKHKRGKRGSKKGKQNPTDEPVTIENNSKETENISPKKTLKMKMKIKKGNLPPGKSPRNKYKHLAINRQQKLLEGNTLISSEEVTPKDTEQRNISNSESNGEQESQGQESMKEKTNSMVTSKSIKKKQTESTVGREDELQTSNTDTGYELEIDGQDTHHETLNKEKSRKKRNRSIVSEDIAANNEEEPKEKRLKKKKKDVELDMGCTPDGGRKGQIKKKGIVKGLSTQVKTTEEDSLIEYEQESPRKKKKKKQKINQTAEENTINTDLAPTDKSVKGGKGPGKPESKVNNEENNPSFTENSDDHSVSVKETVKSKQKITAKSESDETPVVSQKAPVAFQSKKSPFKINKLKHVLGKTPTKEETIDKETSKPVTESPKAKSQKKGPKSLRERMEAQLSGARFRYINEQLYTCTGHEAFQMMADDPDAFKVYHEGFTSQVDKWPQNPVNSVIKFMSARPDAVVADLGCGDAKLAQSINNKVHSFDLVAVNEHVTVCDVAQTPLTDESVDVAVFCLALMGTNLVDFICEANRILKNGGTLIVAEVISRFEKVGSFIRKMLKLGFELSKKDDSNKMFIWFEFKKISESPSPDRQPAIELSPCVYKKR